MEARRKPGHGGTGASGSSEALNASEWRRLAGMDPGVGSIVREIGQRCAASGHPLPPTLVELMVKAVGSDPRNDFKVNQILTKQDVQNLIQLCVARLLNTTNPALSTIKMQVYFNTNYANRAEFLRRQHRVLEGRLASLLGAITGSCPPVEEEMGDVYPKILAYVVQSSGLGSPKDVVVFREVTAVLQRVFPRKEVITFISLSKKNKEEQLKNLTTIVTGILLYSKERGKGGSGIDDLRAVLNEAILSATRTADEHLSTCRVLAHQYTALLESMQEDPLRHTQLSSFKLREALFNVRQREAFLCILLSDITTSATEVEKMNVQFAEAMEKLKKIMPNEISVDRTEDFPLLVVLSNLWTGFKDKILLIKFLTNMINSLQQFSEIQSQLFPKEVLSSLLEGVTVKSDEERIRETMGTRVNVSDFKDQEWLFPETTENFDQLLIEYCGFCAHAIGVKGLLLPGNPAIGILKHKERCYIFSSKEAAYIFAEDPDKFIQLNVEKAKEHTELMQLLELQHHLVHLAPFALATNADKCLMKLTTGCDSTTQTDTHILPPTVVKSYEWNEWTMRKKAIQLANLRCKSTHGMQTDLSHMRRQNSTQVYLPKDVGTQTKCDNSSNVPRPQIFLKGLRGGPSPTTHMVKVHLTRAIDET